MSRDDEMGAADASATAAAPAAGDARPRAPETLGHPRDGHWEASNPDDAVDRVLAGIGAIARALDRYRHAFGAARGFTGTEVIALVHLFQEHTATAGELAARTGLTPGAVTALLDRLERRGYLARTRPQTNRRTVRIELTPAGWALRRDAFDPIEARLRTGPPDLDHMAHGLQQTARLLEETSN